MNQYERERARQALVSGIGVQHAQRDHGDTHEMYPTAVLGNTHREGKESEEAARESGDSGDDNARPGNSLRPAAM